jgi:hypothetical protein
MVTEVHVNHKCIAILVQTTNLMHIALFPAAWVGFLGTVCLVMLLLKVAEHAYNSHYCLTVPQHFSVVLSPLFQALSLLAVMLDLTYS